MNDIPFSSFIPFSEWTKYGKYPGRNVLYSWTRKGPKRDEMMRAGIIARLGGNGRWLFNPEKWVKYCENVKPNEQRDNNRERKSITEADIFFKRKDTNKELIETASFHGEVLEVEVEGTDMHAHIFGPSTDEPYSVVTLRLRIVGPITFGQPT